MPSQADKLLERMRRSKSGWKRRDIDTLYEGFGFVINHGANHDIVTHPDFPELRDTLRRHQKILKAYVKDAVKLVDRLLMLIEESEGSDAQD